MDLFDFRDCQHTFVPSREVLVLREGDAVDQHVRGLVEEEQVSDGQAVPSDERTVVYGQDIVQQAKHFLHFSKGALDLEGVNW